ncbi:MAG: hypothetical protein M0C28_13535 [Candidatus Moduliflexus flocculans]|nr:hypothetical protein [Candidatus Moduliflexus flocculans]
MAIDAVAAKLMGFDPLSTQVHPPRARRRARLRRPARDRDRRRRRRRPTENWHFVGPVQEDDLRVAGCSTRSTGAR